MSSVKALRRALERDESMLVEARVDPPFDAIRDEPAFAAVVPSESKENGTAAVEPPRYAVTLDPGPELMKLVGPRD